MRAAHRGPEVSIFDPKLLLSIGLFETLCSAISYPAKAWDDSAVPRSTAWESSDKIDAAVLRRRLCEQNYFIAANEARICSLMMLSVVFGVFS